MTVAVGVSAPTWLAADASAVATAGLTEAYGRTVVAFTLGGGPHRGAIGGPEGMVLERAARSAVELGVPLVGRLETSGIDVHSGLDGLHAWGRTVRAFHDASGTVPTVLAVTGPCVSAPALLLGLADHVVMTEEAFAYVSGPGAVASITGVATSHIALGGAAVHATRSGVASLVVAGQAEIEAAVADLLGYLPANSLEDPPAWVPAEARDRRCDRAAATVPDQASASYDMRDVVGDVLDAESFLELRSRWAANLVVGLGRLDGRVVGVVANQPCRRAGTVDIDASVKAARFVQWCDAFNVPVLTFVDTPGFEPGKDLEWRGMIRHGAKLVHAYAEATVPRIAVVVRKAFGGAYIVMDSKGLGNDLCVAWPSAQIAVMGAPGAVAVLHGRRLAAVDDAAEREAERARLEEGYAQEFLNPWRAAERGYVDGVIDPADTRAVVAQALPRLSTKRERAPQRRHSNTPL